MSPPLAVTEDTPPDMLAGAMDLLIVLPNGHNVVTSVDRSTPMMDLLIQITTANKISPSGHAIRAYADRGILPYQPSTPIGALDAWSVHIVPKKCWATAKKQPPPPAPEPAPFKAANQNTPFEQTFRLQVNLPRNQLYVTRVGYKTRLDQVFRQACEEKNLDPVKYCLVHPDRLDEELNADDTFLDYKLQKVTLIARSNRPPAGLSSVDIMALKSLNNADQSCGNKYYASHSYDGSVSSGSLEGRSLSPVRSDESSSSPTTSQSNPTSSKPFKKRRPAPKPPTSRNGRECQNGCGESSTALHSRNSSDSSGYHESSVLSESPGSNSNCLADSLPKRSKSPDNVCQRRLHSNAKCASSKAGNNLSRSLSNLATEIDDRRKYSKHYPSGGMKPKQYSASSTSLFASSGKRKKAPAPPPPLPSTTSCQSLLSLQEEETPGAACVEECADADAPGTHSSPRSFPSSAPSASSSVDSRSRSVTHTVTVDVTASQPVCTDHTPAASTKDKELTMDDEEIDRIFGDATKGYGSATSSAISSPPELAENHDLDVAADNDLAVVEQRDQLSENRDPTPPLSPSPPNAICDRADGARLAKRSDFATWCTTAANAELTFNEEPRLKERVESHSAASPPAANKERGISSIRVFVDQGAAVEEDKRPHETAPAATKWECRYQSSSSTLDSGLGSDDSIATVGLRESKAADSCGSTTSTTFTEPKPKAIERRPSTLQNFTISTYSDTKPTEIFHDDSVKTWRTTELARSNRPFVSQQNARSAAAAATNLGRHCSFNAAAATADRLPGSLVKRSKSHISLLSGNFAKFNRFGKLDVNVSCAGDDEPDAASAEFDRWTQNKLRSQSLPVTNSAFARRRTAVAEPTTINVSHIEDADMERNQLSKSRNGISLSGRPEVKSAHNHESNSQLQSLQILKNILPRIDRMQLENGLETSTFEPNPYNQSYTASQRRCWTETKTLSPSGEMSPPSVKLQPWNERPCRQVGIKTDRDYVFGGRARTNCGPSYDQPQQQHQRLQQQNRWSGDQSSSVDDDVSRVPVVTAVEFKKPLTPPSRPTVEDDEPAGGLSSSTTTPTSSATGRVCGFTFKQYKNKLALQERCSSRKGAEEERCSVVGNGDQRRVWEDVGGGGNGGRRKQPSSDDRAAEAGGPKAGPADVRRACGAAPSPFVVPALRPVNRELAAANGNAKRLCSAAAADLDPRDLFLSSIKSFDRDRLRKLRVK